MKQYIFTFILIFNVAMSQNDYYKKGIEAQKNNNHKLAIEYFSSSILNQPDSIKNYFKRGISFFELKDFKKSIDDFTVSIDNNFNQRSSYFYRGLSYEKQNQLEIANGDYKEVLKIDSTLNDIYGMIGVNYFQIKKYDEALKYFNICISKSPPTSENYVRRGNTYDMLREFEKAIKDYDKAIALDSNYAPAFFNRGIAYRDNNRYSESLDDFSMAIKLNSENSEYYYNRAFVNVQINNSKKAIEDFLSYLKLNDNKSGNLLSVYNYIKGLGYRDSVKTKKYFDVSKTFSLSLPDSWFMKKTDDGKTSQLFISKKKIINPTDVFEVGVTANFIRRVSKSFKNFTNDTEIVNGWSNAILIELQKNKNFEVISSSHWVIEKYKGYLFEVKFQPDKSDTDVRILKLVLANNDNLLDITIESPNDRYNDYRTIFYEALCNIDIL